MTTRSNPLPLVPLVWMAVAAAIGAGVGTTAAIKSAPGLSPGVKKDLTAAGTTALLPSLMLSGAAVGMLFVLVRKKRKGRK